VLNGPTHRLVLKSSCRVAGICIIIIVALGRAFEQLAGSELDTARVTMKLNILPKFQTVFKGVELLGRPI
jgi:hypothetical protein